MTAEGDILRALAGEHRAARELLSAASGIVNLATVEMTIARLEARGETVSSVPDVTKAIIATAVRGQVAHWRELGISEATIRGTKVWRAGNAVDAKEFPA